MVKQSPLTHRPFHPLIVLFAAALTVLALAAPVFAGGFSLPAPPTFDEPLGDATLDKARVLLRDGKASSALAVLDKRMAAIEREVKRTFDKARAKKEPDVGPIRAVFDRYVEGGVLVVRQDRFVFDANVLRLLAAALVSLDNLPRAGQVYAEILTTDQADADDLANARALADAVDPTPPGLLRALAAIGR